MNKPFIETPSKDQPEQLQAAIDRGLGVYFGDNPGDPFGAVQDCIADSPSSVEMSAEFSTWIATLSACLNQLQGRTTS